MIGEREGGVGIGPVPTLRWNVDDALCLDVGRVQLVDPGVGAQRTDSLIPRDRSRRQLQRPESSVRIELQDGGRLADDDYDPAGIFALEAQFFF